jgi:hypothetical protein
MNKIGILLMLAVSTGLFGCATNGTMGDVDPELDCRDRRVTVNHGPAFLIAYPEYIEVCAGQTITVQVTPRVPAGEAATMQGSGDPVEASWLNNRNRSESSEILIEVPEAAAYAVYKYSIRIAGVGTLDPRVRVVRR